MCAESFSASIPPTLKIIGIGGKPSSWTGCMRWEAEGPLGPVKVGGF